MLTWILMFCMALPSQPAEPPGGNGTVPMSPNDVHPLGVGDRVPPVSVRSMDGTVLNLRDLAQRRPTVLIFYRGGWCPYCNRHLSRLQEIENDLVHLGYQILAISPDRPEKLRETRDRHGMKYTLLSDSDMTAARAFGLAFRLDPATLERYREMGLDLEAWSGRNHHLLPVPAAYVVDSKGVIRFVYYNPDYKVRIDPRELLNAARKALNGPS